MASRASLDAKMHRLEELLAEQAERTLADFQRRLDLSWIFYDAALEGIVITNDELKSAIERDLVPNISLIPIHDEIRAHILAIEFVRDIASRGKKAPLTLDTILQIHDVLSPKAADAADAAGGPYRKDTPVHRIYPHNIPAAEKIDGEMKKLGDWLAEPETKKLTSLRLAARLHFKLMQIHPFAKHSGRIARLAMNLVLMRAGYPPAIIHATDRQRYFEAFKGPSALLYDLVVDSLENSIDSAIRVFEDGRPG